MCLMCVEIQKERMKLSEVVRALGEFVPPKDHEDELTDVIFSKFGMEDTVAEFIKQNKQDLLEVEKII
jgi:hypothetical protein